MRMTMKKRHKKNSKRNSDQHYIQLRRSVLNILKSEGLNLTSFGAYIVFLLTARWDGDQYERYTQGPSKIARLTGVNKSTWSRHYQRLHEKGLLEDETGYVPYFYERNPDTYDEKPQKLQPSDAEPQQDTANRQQPVSDLKPKLGPADFFGHFVSDQAKPIIEAPVADMQHQSRQLDTNIERNIKDNARETVGHLKAGRRPAPKKCKKCRLTLQGPGIVWASLKKDGLCEQCRDKKLKNKKGGDNL